MNKLYPIDYITYYNKEGKLPNEVPISLKHTRSLGFHVLKLTPDNYKVPEEIKAYHAGFKHMRDITMPKIMKLYNTNKNLKGFFIAEGDVWIYDDFDFNTFLKKKFTKPTWIGYKKKLSNYIVGNFLIYFPRKFIPKLNDIFQQQTQLVYSDRFFTKLYYNGFIELLQEPMANEIEHYSNVHKGIRKSNIKLNNM
jgi:hypothetical protein